MRQSARLAPRLRSSLIENLELRRLFAAGFQIELAYDASVSASVRTVLQQAANRWQQIITGDVPDVGAGSWGAAVDDIRISVSVISIDGAGRGLAQTRPTYIRTGSHLPIAGEMQIDSADVASMSAAGTLDDTLTHEMAHALGYGTIWSQYPGLTTGLGGSNPLYLGANALREYRTYANNYSLTGVPLENTGGTGTRDTHWRETTFNNEALTGFVNNGSNPISRVSIGQFADLGYTVNYYAADYYTLPGVTPPPTSTGTLSGKVYNDANKNGVLDGGEAGLSGRTVYIDLNYNGVLDGGEKSTTTDASGNYALTGLAASNSYAVREVVPSGSTQTTPAGNNAWWTSLGAGATVGNLNFGVAGSTVTPPPTGGGTVSGKVFNDANYNGKQDSTEGGLSGRTVYVDLNYNGSRDSNERTATTDANGNYAIAGLAASNAYAVRQVVPSGSTQTTPSGNNAWWISLGAGATVGNLNFGVAGSTVTPPPTGGSVNISGKVFRDANWSGTKDSTEAGISGRTVYADKNYNGKFDAGEVSVLTNASGDYTFTSLAAGTYAIREVLPSGWYQTTPSGDGAWWITVGSGTIKSGLNFGAIG